MAESFSKPPVFLQVHVVHGFGLKVTCKHGYWLIDSEGGSTHTQSQEIVLGDSQKQIGFYQIPFKNGWIL